MAFPWLFEENFEGGTKGSFDSETDSDSRLDFAGPEELAVDALDVAPFRGGYLMRVSMEKGSAQAYVSSDAFAASLGTTRWARYYLYLSDDFAASGDGALANLFWLDSAGPTWEMGVSLMRKDPEGIVLVVQSSDDDDSGPYIKINPGEWTCIEVEYKPDSSNSVISIIVNGSKATLTNFVSAALTTGRFGIFQQAGDFRGTIYLDQIVLDDERVHGIMEGQRDSSNVDGMTMLFTKSGFAFVGSGEILEVQAIDNGSSDARVKVYDTDNPNLVAEYDKRIDRTFSNFLPLQPTNFERGAFVKLEGTTPQALVRVGTVNEFDYLGDRLSGGQMPVADDLGEEEQDLSA